MKGFQLTFPLSLLSVASRHLVSGNKQAIDSVRLMGALIPLYDYKRVPGDKASFLRFSSSP